MPENDAWFVWAAQIVNFLILVALLRKFLYRPVLEAIESRQQEIAARMTEAEQSRQEAEERAETLREREHELEAARDKLMAEAREEIEEWKQNALQQTRAEVEEAQAHWWDALERDRRRLLSELRERAGRQVHQITRHVLTELAGTNLEQQMVAVFLGRLESLDQNTRDRLISGNAKESGCTLTTALPLSDDQHQRIREGLRDEFGEVESLQFEVDAELICGVELQMGDQRLSWNVADTMESLERNFAAALDHGHASSLAGKGAS